MDWLFSHRQGVDFILSAGFSGALQAGLSVGDLIWASKVVDLSGTSYPVAESIARLLPNAVSGRVLTVPELVGDPERKRLLGQQFQAVAVDMETATIARRCQEQGVSFGCLRVISDDWNTPLSPRLVEVLGQGQVAPLGLLCAVLRQPSLLGEMWRLGRHTHLAARRLAEGLRHVLRLE